MKLTKGKMSKIQNKKNQSAKRFKKGGKKYKTKTFRKRKAFNLHNKSLKKYKGGQLEAKVQEEAKQQEESKVGEPTKMGEPLSPEPVVENTVALAESSEPVQETQNHPEGLSNTDDQNPSEGPSKTEEVVAAQEVAPQSETIQPIEGESQVGPQLEKEEQEPSEEQELSVVESEPKLEEQQLAETPEVEPEVEVHTEPEAQLEEPQPVIQDAQQDLESHLESETHPEELSSHPEELSSDTELQPVQLAPTQPVKSEASIVAESLDKLAEYISDKIAKKLRFNTSTELNRDSFNAVANANQSMAEY